MSDQSRSRPNRRPGIAPRKLLPDLDPPTPKPEADRRECPWCGSRDLRLFKRGYTGPTDERDQYFACEKCRRVTYEMMSKTNRDMRLAQFRVGGTLRDSAHQTRYSITRVLKVGFNEYLLYVKPIIPSSEP